MLQQPADTKMVSLFGMQIHAVTMEQAVTILSQWAHERSGPCRYVVTPNVDHAVMFREQEPLRAAYGDASLVVADGLPLVITSRLLRKTLPERVAGSDLVPALFASADPRHSLRTFLLGAAPGVADRAAKHIMTRWPHVKVTGTYSPPLGFEKDERENTEILTRIAAANADVLVIGLGAPKQELWIQAHRHRVQAAVALCAGATIDFLAGEKQRAPRWIQKVGLEWFHRMLTDPRRLVRRYARDAWVLPQLIWHEIAQQRTSEPESSRCSDTSSTCSSCQELCPGRYFGQDERK